MEPRKNELVKPNGGEGRAEVPDVGRPESSIFNAKGVIQTLESLMIKVTNEDCTASTVNAACNCAARITDLLRVHLEVERLADSRKKRDR
jgi:hypothetical protein